MLSSKALLEEGLDLPIQGSQGKAAQGVTIQATQHMPVKCKWPCQRNSKTDIHNLQAQKQVTLPTWFHVRPQNLQFPTLCCN